MLFTRRMMVLANESDARFKVLDQIHQEFRPNGGGSLRDVIDRIDHSTTNAHGMNVALINYHDIAAFRANSKGELTWVSTQWCTLHGILPPQALGNGWMVSVHQDDRAAVIEEWESAIEQGRAFSATFRVGSQDNGYLRVLGEAAILHNSKKVVVGYVGTLSPLDEAKVDS